MSSRLKKDISRFLVLIGLFLPVSGICQSFIEGTVYFYDKKEFAVGCNIVITDSIKTDSIALQNFNGIILDGFTGINGYFKIENTKENRIDLLIAYVGYRNTIIKNIPTDIDTIKLNGIPLFIDDNVIHATLVLNKRQRFFSRFRKKYWHDQSIIGTEGPFTYDTELEINCMVNSANKVKCKKTRFGIEIDYNEIKTCGNRLFLSLGLMIQMQNFYYL